ncbi:MAG: tryptophan--tRNA ligase [Candidatus Woesearchaeota archaeon]
MENVFNPWEVTGDINYVKLMQEFGIKPLQHLPDIFMQNTLFRRQKIFAHRDFKQIIDAIEQKKPFVMMTGLMPTGNFHIGHMILAKQFLFYQNLGAKLYIAVADIEAYNARGQSLEESREIAIDQYIKNYIAMGLKPENVEIYFQSERSKDATKANAYYQLQNLCSAHATFNEFKAVYGEISPGKMSASLLQSADMLHPMLPEFEGPIPVLVPVGTDQDPHLRLTRDIIKKVKEKNLKNISSTYHVFVPGLGGGKMSSSDATSFVALTDDYNTIKKKINKYAFSGGQATLEEHKAKGGNPDIDIAYQWLTFFEEDDQKLEKIYTDYKKGSILSGEMKSLCIEKLYETLKPIQEKRTTITEETIGQFGL